MSAATTPRAEAFAPVRESTGARIGRTLLGTAPIFLVLIGLLVWITIENPNFTNPNVFLTFMRRAAPLMILAAGQLFVVLAGEFDLSVGALIT
ncbi:MAG: ABC transporter permease, partial [Chloroflexia bacterium]|nr:ABC transporter permease [Chloroflexia bacterium]